MAEEMLRIRFTENRSGEGYAYKKGEVYELTLSRCHRWVRRNVAVYVDVGGMETTTVPHEAKQPAPKFHKGADGEGSFGANKVPDLIPLDDAENAEEPQKKTQGHTKRK